ncbi:MAG TPA: ABC transporter permease, partial [Verrucomicrobiae bacterium]
MNFLTELREGLNISWSAIRANKLRSVLTTLGIVIGVLTVTLMGTAIDGLNNSFLNSISSIGADVFYVDRYNWFIQSRQEWVAQMKNPTIKINEVDALQNQMTLADAIAPVARMQEPVQYEKSGSTGVQVIGSTEQ